MRRIWFVCLIALLSGAGHVVATGAEDATLDDRTVSSSSQVDIVVEVPFAVQQLTVSCMGTVTIEYSADDDRSVLLDSTILDYGQEAIDRQEDIVLVASSTSRVIELGAGHDAYRVALNDTGLPYVPQAQVGNCNSALAVEDLSVDCFGTATIDYSASGEAPRVWLTTFRDGADPAPGYRLHDLDPAETRAVIPAPDPPASWDGTVVIHAQLEWLTPDGGEERAATCTPEIAPTPTAPPVPIDVIVQTIIAIIQSILADMNG